MHLWEILALERLDDDVFRASTPPGSNRPDIFGGQVAGQALHAAGQTVESDHLPNSVHCYFLRRGRPDLPIDLFVERTRQGRTYTSRRVAARQQDKIIFTMLASFHADEPGDERELPMPKGVSSPRDLAPDGGADGGSMAGFPVEMRSVPTDGIDARHWARVASFPPDPLLQACALLYVSDMRAGSPAIRAIGLESVERGGPRPTDRSVDLGSLDHAMWFHRPPRVDRWILCDVRSLTVRDSRGLVLGTMHDEEGRHVATFTQEMFLKVAPG